MTEDEASEVCVPDIPARLHGPCVTGMRSRSVCDITVPEVSSRSVCDVTVSGMSSRSVGDVTVSEMSSAQCVTSCV